MKNRIDETDSDLIIAYLKERKTGGKLADVYGVNDPNENDRPGILDCPPVRNVSFFDSAGSAAVSSVPAEKIHLIEVDMFGCRAGDLAVWVRTGKKHLLDRRPEWSKALRIRYVQ